MPYFQPTATDAVHLAKAVTDSVAAGVIPANQAENLVIVCGVFIHPAAKDDIVVLGELHVPVDRNVIIDLSSKDVIHNFCLPSMRIAQDAIPGQIIPMWFKPIKTGTFEVVCGQLCGLGHYSMKGTLVVDTPADYQAWLKERVELSGNQSAPPVAAPTPGAPKTANPGGG
jgi:heme/copper-type cytochrome/quinol oxidase subunit 2